MIPNDAVEAAADTLLGILPATANAIPLWALQQALEAAAPYMLAEALGMIQILANARIEGDRPEEDIEWARNEYRKSRA